MIIPKMGTKRPPTPSAGIADVLFTPVQQRVLGLLFGQPDRTFQSAELISLAGSGTGAVHRFLTRLAEAGLVRVERIGNQKHYQANRDSPVFKEMNGLILKTSGLTIPLQLALAALAERIKAAFIYGSIAKGKDHAKSDIDLMVIADRLEYADLYEALRSAEAQLGRAINPNVMTISDWRRKKTTAGFIAKIADQPRVFIVGAEDDLP